MSSGFPSFPTFHWVRAQCVASALLFCVCDQLTYLHSNTAGMTCVVCVTRVLAPTYVHANPGMLANPLTSEWVSVGTCKLHFWATISSPIYAPSVEISTLSVVYTYSQRVMPPKEIINTPVSQKVEIRKLHAVAWILISFREYNLLLVGKLL